MNDAAVAGYIVPLLFTLQTAQSRLEDLLYEAGNLCGWREDRPEKKKEVVGSMVSMEWKMSREEGHHRGLSSNIRASIS